MAKFSIGDKVIVTQRIGNEDDGFKWVEPMNDAIGKVATVEQVSYEHNETGRRYQLIFVDSARASGYWYKEGSLIPHGELASDVGVVTRSHVDTVEPKQPHVGRTNLRDEFAIHAPPPPAWYPRKVFNQTNDQMFFEKEEDRFFRWAYYYADKMMKARGV